MSLDDIRGAGGGGGKSGGGSSGQTPTEAPDNLHSTAFARVLDLISEGEIGGLVNGLQSVYLNETPVQNPDSSYNFQNVQVDSRVGAQVQDYIKGFEDVESETAVSIELRYGTPWVLTLTDMTLSAVAIRLAVPALSKTDLSTGDTSGYVVAYMIELKTDGGSYETVFTGSFNGKTTSTYQRQHRIDLPPASSQWMVRVTRTTTQANSQAVQDTTLIDSYTEIIDELFSYPNSALVGTVVDSSQFSTIPTRAFNCYGRLIRIPSNYNPIARTYSGTWDGTFQVAFSNNPAWCYFDLCTNARYGLGDVITDAMVDKWALYQIGQYCDGYVKTGVPKRAAVTTGPITMTCTAPNSYGRASGSFVSDGFAVGDEIWASGFDTAGNNGRGVVTGVTALALTVDVDHVLTTEGSCLSCSLTTQDFTEPRWTCALYLQAQADAFKVLQDMASVFRGISYWAAGMITPVADQPSDAVYTFANANVLGGKFSYSGSARKARHTVALVSWNDNTDMGRLKVEYVQDPIGIQRYGIRTTQVVAMGCTSRSTANRIGRFILATERLLTETVTFAVGLDGSICLPGQVINIADAARAGRRIGGRIHKYADGEYVGVRYTEDGCIRTTEDGDVRIIEGTGSTYDTIFVDAMPSVPPSIGDTLFVNGADGISVSRTIIAIYSTAIVFAPPLDDYPPDDAVWATQSATLRVQTFRVVSIAEADDGMSYTITALTYDPTIYDFVENGTLVQLPPVSSIPRTQAAIASVALSTFQRSHNFGSETVVRSEWAPSTGATSYEVEWRRDGGEWIKHTQAGTSSEFTAAYPGNYRCRVTAIGAGAKKAVAVTSSPLSISLATRQPMTNTPVPIAAVSGVFTPDCSVGTRFSIALNANATLAAPINVPQACTIMIYVTNGGGYTLAMASCYQPADGTPYSATPASGATDLIAADTITRGALWAYTFKKLPGGGSAFAISLSNYSPSGSATSSGSPVTASATSVATINGGTLPIVSSGWTYADIGTSLLTNTGSGLTATLSRTARRTNITERWRFQAVDSAGLVASAIAVFNILIDDGTGYIGNPGGDGNPGGEIP